MKRSVDYEAAHDITRILAAKAIACCDNDVVEEILRAYDGACASLLEEARSEGGDRHVWIRLDGAIVVAVRDDISGWWFAYWATGSASGITPLDSDPGHMTTDQMFALIPEGESR